MALRSAKKYIIKKDKHSASGFHFGITFKKHIKFRACFTESCLYNLGNNDNYDINKLYGFSSSYFHHYQSARVGWRCVDGKNIELLTYSYNDGLRSLNDSDLLGEVKPDQWFTCEIIDHEDSYEYRFSTDINEEKRLTTAKDLKQKDWFPFHYILYPYFGGNQTAPHEIKIYLERL